MGAIFLAAIPSYLTYKYMKKDAQQPSMETINGYIRENVNKNVNDRLANADGYKINSTISTTTLEDQRDTIQSKANELGAQWREQINTLNRKYGRKFPEELKKHLEQWKKGTLGSAEFKKLIDTVFDTQINHVVAQLMNEELVAREKFQKKLDASLPAATNLNTLESYKKEARSPEQINQIQVRIDEIKAEEDRKKAIADAEKKLAEAKTEEEKLKAKQDLDNLLNQGSAAVGTVSKATGIPKGALYIGIGIAVVITGVLIYRGIRK
jgi:hypothetical protein